MLSGPFQGYGILAGRSFILVPLSFSVRYINPTQCIFLHFLAQKKKKKNHLNDTLQSNNTLS